MVQAGLLVPLVFGIYSGYFLGDSLHIARPGAHCGAPLHLQRPMDAVYAELHCHSTFSLLDGASDPERLVERAAELGLAALALTDHDDLGGAVRFATAASAAGLPGIIGAELTIEEVGSWQLVVGGDGQPPTTHHQPPTSNCIPNIPRTCYIALCPSSTSKPRSSRPATSPGRSPS